MDKCYQCKETVIEKSPACPLQCMSTKCKAFNSSKCVDSSKTPVVWLIGVPGCGKSTICGQIASKYGFSLFVSGDLVRAEAKNDSKRAQCLNTVLKRNELLPNDVVLDLIKEAIFAVRDHAKGFIVDGYPINKPQCLAFEREISPANVIIYLEASTDTLTTRMMSRTNDAELIRKRMKTFEEDCELISAHYPSKMRRINADEPVESVFRQVQKVLDPIVTNARTVTFSS